MNTLTYGDLLYIRDALVNERTAKFEACVAAERDEDTEGADILFRDYNGMGDTLGRIEVMIEERWKDPAGPTLKRPNAESLAAMEEARNWRNLPRYKTVEELMQALHDD